MGGVFACVGWWWGGESVGHWQVVSVWVSGCVRRTTEGLGTSCGLLETAEIKEQ